jgi:hypothetical protein
MSNKVAGINVHKKVLMVVVIDSTTPDVKPGRRRFSTMPTELHHLSTWLQECGIEEVVMESTAQYWRSVWLELEPHMSLHLVESRVLSASLACGSCGAEPGFGEPGLRRWRRSGAAIYLRRDGSSCRGWDGIFSQAAYTQRAGFHFRSPGDQRVCAGGIGQVVYTNGYGRAIKRVETDRKR